MVQCFINPLWAIPSSISPQPKPSSNPLGQAVKILETVFPPPSSCLTTPAPSTPPLPSSPPPIQQSSSNPPDQAVKSLETALTPPPHCITTPSSSTPQLPSSLPPRQQPSSNPPNKAVKILEPVLPPVGGYKSRTSSVGRATLEIWLSKAQWGFR